MYGLPGNSVVWPSATMARGRVARYGWIAIAVLFLFAAIVVPVYRTVPLRNNLDPQVDALLVLGTPTEMDGSLKAAQRWRADEAVREFRAGRAQHIVFSGGPTSHGFVEADTMARYALGLGVPASAILEERRAMTTIENVRFSQRILLAHGWRRVEVISAAEHLPRAALLLRHSDLLWQMHAAPTPGRSRLGTAMAYSEEAVGTAVIRCFGLHILPVLHGFATVQHKAGFAVRWVFYTARRKLRLS